MGEAFPSRSDPRDEPNYTLAEAALYLRLKAQRVRLWAVGLQNDTSHRVPLFDVAQRHPPMLSFWNLIEVYVLAGMRLEHNVPMQKVRRALRYVSSELDIARPLIHQEFVTDGIDLFVGQYGALVNASEHGQTAIRETLEGSLRRVERDAQGLALRVFPWRHSPDDPRFFEIDPTKAAGRLVVAGTRVPVEILAERFRGGDVIKDLAADYDLPPEKVEAALQWM